MKKIISPFSSKSSSPLLPVATSEGKLGSRSNMGTESSRPSTADVPMKDDGDEQTSLVERKLAQAAVGERVLEPIDKSFLQRVAKYTPLRLTEEERVLLGVVEGALDHSEFTSNVDVSASMHYVRETYDRDERVENEILEFCRVLLGLSAANDYGTKGKKTLGDNLVEREAFFQRCMEIGRRFKILNPDKMRDTYGKLLYLLMDANTPSIRRRLKMKLVQPIQTVATLLDAFPKEWKEKFMDDDALLVACSELTTASPELARQKQEATQFLADRYGEHLGTQENVRRIVASLEDALSFLRSNRDPVDKLIGYLKRHFEPRREPEDYAISLSLQNRNVKPRHELTHDHRTQYTFVLQSLMLWRDVMGDFFKLWIGAEEDLLDPSNGYRLMNTGQGMQRCQGARITRGNMHEVLAHVQSKTTSWVGLQVVHLGDREVPNALVFIDKYTQVPRIIAPIVRCLEAIEGELSQNQAIRSYICSSFKSPEYLVKLVLADLYRGGFDGGGDLGGSCIDGRLTSLWNWASLIEKKSYYPIFLISGFLGFDGKF